MIIVLDKLVREWIDLRREFVRLCGYVRLNLMGWFWMDNDRGVVRVEVVWCMMERSVFWEKMIERMIEGSWGK